MRVLSLSWEDPLEEGMATHTSILAWRIPMDSGAWQAIVHGVTKSWTRLSTHESGIRGLPFGVTLPSPQSLLLRTGPRGVRQGKGIAVGESTHCDILGNATTAHQPAGLGNVN